MSDRRRRTVAGQAVGVALVRRVFRIDAQPLEHGLRSGVRQCFARAGVRIAFDPGHIFVAADVPDPRVTTLSEMFKPRKTIYTKVTYADIAGLEAGSAKSGISGQLLNQLS